MRDPMTENPYADDPNVLYLPDPPEIEPGPTHPDLDSDHLDLSEESPDDDLEQEAGSLLHTDSYLGEVKAALSGCYAGPTYPVELLVLVLHSRHLGEPVSAVVRGESSAGKSYAIKQALKFVSPEGYYPLTASSEKALIYSKENLQHRHLVLYEGDGIGGEFASYVVRSLLSEGRVDYEYVDFDSKSTRQITKEGPTGLILSTAGKIDYELGTRLLSIPIDDSPEITAEILKIEALAAAGPVDPPDLGAFLAFDRLLASESGRVVVPFAPKLAEKTDARAVRMRRDFSGLLGLIKTHALIHRHARERGPDDEIIASIADYEVVHGLVSKLLADAAGRSVPEPVRDAAEAVTDLYVADPSGDITIGQVAEELERDRSTASRSLNRAVAMGYVTVLSKQGSRHKIFQPGDRLPDDTEVLPAPEELS